MQQFKAHFFEFYLQFNSCNEIGPAFSGPAFSYCGNLGLHFPVVSVGLWSIWSLVLHFLVLLFQLTHILSKLI